MEKEVKFNEVESLTKVKGWILAVDEEKSLIISVEKPIMVDGMWFCACIWSLKLKDVTFPGITDETGPVEAEIYIRPLK